MGAGGVLGAGAREILGDSHTRTPEALEGSHLPSMQLGCAEVDSARNQGGDLIAREQGRTLPAHARQVIAPLAQVVEMRRPRCGLWRFGGIGLKLDGKIYVSKPDYETHRRQRLLLGWQTLQALHQTTPRRMYLINKMVLCRSGAAAAHILQAKTALHVLIESIKDESLFRTTALIHAGEEFFSAYNISLTT